MIRLLDAENQTLHQFRDEDCPPYVILSHRWAEDPSEEVIYNDMAQFHELSSSKAWKKAKSAAKLIGACRKVLETLKPDGVDVKHLWIDTVCIRQDNPMELSTAINSMFRLYREAYECLVYLADFPSANVQTLGQSDWFNRGWTLQELLAPRFQVTLCDMNWKYLGSRKSLAKELTRRTGIGSYYLHNLRPSASISERMSWMVGRKTTVSEDTAYCLLGLFDVNMPLLYGEGKERAFLRLQEEIMKYSDDHTLFVWKNEDGHLAGTSPHSSGLLAHSPDCFRSTGHYRRYPDPENSRPYQMNNKGIAIDLRLRVLGDGDKPFANTFIAPLNCRDDNLASAGVYLQQKPGSLCCRIWPDKIAPLREPHRGELQSIYVKDWDGIAEFDIMQKERITGEWIDRFREHTFYDADGKERPHAKENWDYVLQLMAKDPSPRMVEQLARRTGQPSTHGK